MNLLEYISQTYALIVLNTLQHDNSLYFLAKKCCFLLKKWSRKKVQGCINTNVNMESGY